MIVVNFIVKIAKLISFFLIVIAIIISIFIQFKCEKYINRQISVYELKYKRKKYVPASLVYVWLFSTKQIEYFEKNTWLIYSSLNLKNLVRTKGYDIFFYIPFSVNMILKF